MNDSSTAGAALSPNIQAAVPATGDLNHERLATALRSDTRISASSGNDLVEIRISYAAWQMITAGATAHLATLKGDAAPQGLPLRLNTPRSSSQGGEEDDTPLRDTFAAHALVGLYSSLMSGTVLRTDDKDLRADATLAYRIADAMLLARSAPDKAES